MKKTNLLLSLLIPTVVVMAVACGDDDDDDKGTAGAAGSAAGTTSTGGSAGTSAGAAGTSAGAAGASAGAAGSTAGTGGTAGGAAGTGGATGGAGGAATNSKSGTVTFGVFGITEIAGLPNPIVSNVASAAFVDATGSASSGSCTTTDEGGCKLTTCTLGAGGAGGSGGAAGGPTAASSGDITITGGQITPVVLSFSDGTYKVTTPAPSVPGAGLPTDKAAFNGGESIEIKSAGGTVPTFTLTSKAPTSPTVTGLPTPPATPGSPVDIETGSDINLTITGGTDGNVSFLASASTTSQSATLVCSAAATASSLKVPSSGLAKLKAVNATGVYSASLTSTATGKAGDWDVTVTLPNILKGSDGKAATAAGQANFKLDRAAPRAPGEGRGA